MKDYERLPAISIQIKSSSEHRQSIVPMAIKRLMLVGFCGQQTVWNFHRIVSTLSPGKVPEGFQRKFGSSVVFKDLLKALSRLFLSLEPLIRAI